MEKKVKKFIEATLSAEEVHEVLVEFVKRKLAKDGINVSDDYIVEDRTTFEQFFVLFMKEYNNKTFQEMYDEECKKAQSEKSSSVQKKLKELLTYSRP